MGQYFRIVNVTKRQFIDIDELGENNKLWFVGQGLNGIALGRLLASHGETDEVWGKYFGQPTKDKIYIGAWAGDRIVIAGDNDFADSNSITSSSEDNPNQNLYYMVESNNEYENVTEEIIIWLSKDNQTAEMLAIRAKNNSELLKKLITIISDGKNQILKEHLIKLMGNNINDS